MPSFRYTAILPTGELSRGLMDAADEAAVVRALQKAGSLPVRTDPAAGGFLSDLMAMEFGARRGLRKQEVADLTRELSIMLAAGQDLSGDQRSWLVESAAAVRDAPDAASHRMADSRFHLAVASLSGSPMLIESVTRAQAARILVAVGIVVLASSAVVMPLLARAKRRVAAGLGSRALAADAAQTSLCAYLSGIALVGLMLNAFVGWWWADPVSALVMLPIIAKEALEGLRGEACSDCAGVDDGCGTAAMSSPAA